MKPTLDACCGGRMFYFGKTIRMCFCRYKKPKLSFKDRDKIRRLEVSPDVIHDFTDMPYP